MNKVFLSVCASVLLFASCASEPDVYVPFDYSQNDVVRNEIGTVRGMLADKPVTALWRVFLLKRNGAGSGDVVGEIAALYDECAAVVAAGCVASEASDDVLNALRLYTSLEAVQYPLLSEIPFSAESLASRVVRSVPGLGGAVGSAGNAASDAVPVSAPAKVSSFINGTVTVWVDLGIRVTKGVGYADRVIGSGFFIDPSGYIVTNYHVIQSEVDPAYEGYSRLYVKLAEDSDTRIPAKVVGWDPVLDLALLKVEVDAPFSFSLGSSADLDIGDRIFAIGSPVGLERTLTSGIVSAVDRKLFTVGSIMQIDAAVNSGNSGGPIIDGKGNVQAIVFAGMLAYEGLNFAIPVEYLKAELPLLFKGGKREHGWIGAFGKDIKADPITGRPAGLEVQYVMPGGSAHRSGIAAGDVITAVNGTAVDGLDAFQSALLHMMADTIVTVDTVKADGGSETFTVYIEARPENPGYLIYRSDVTAKAFIPIFGMELTPVSVSDKKKYTVTNILKGSSADEAGFSVYDPVELIKIEITPDKDGIFVQVYTKKRKSGYLDVNIAVGAQLDSPYYF
ncbi:S1C family serine protease [Treponema brennaborense]|uniref:Peptidase S1 and S6 chymotrypsin/Hap n=1 Tax=Treponema brennaborense (strain DSM 12168 / CIP 105900 / DD5/3) TaxID=906968 RepID=F4LQH9_TREBD|nr:trypsin-like peptidase domain-containing protein [Treponema brennaborense]AEE17188.1 peptidase S1 and S6 chymotrypsin/Hap [Treponema brennaborense DSM 12168]